MARRTRPLPARRRDPAPRGKSVRDTEAVERMLMSVRAAGLKLTPQRVAIVRELAADPSHPTAQELYERLVRVLPTMSFATVYNTLASLAAAGLCQSRVLTHGPARFDPMTGPHDHTVCDSCGSVADVPAERAPANVLDFEVRAVERVYRGRCGACALEELRDPHKLRPAPRPHPTRSER